MAQDSCRFRVVNHLGRDSVLVIEPWATEYPFPPGKAYEVVLDGNPTDEFEIEWFPDRVVVYPLHPSGTMITVYENGVPLP